MCLLLVIINQNKKKSTLFKLSKFTKVNMTARSQELLTECQVLPMISPQCECCDRVEANRCVPVWSRGERKREERRCDRRLMDCRSLQRRVPRFMMRCRLWPPELRYSLINLLCVPLERMGHSCGGSQWGHCRKNPFCHRAAAAEPWRAMCLITEIYSLPAASTEEQLLCFYALQEV